MAAGIPQHEDVFASRRVAGEHWIVTHIEHDGDSTTFTVPLGVTHVAEMSDNTATVAVSGTTVTVSNGEAGDVVVVSRLQGRGTSI